MATLVPPFSKAELLAELRTTMVVFASEIGRMYTHDTGALRMLGLDPTLDNSDFDDLSESLDLSTLAITRDVEALYDFAFEGRHAAGLDWSVVCEDLYPFLRAVEAHEEVVYQAGMPRRLRHVIELGVARAVVNGDCEEVIPIRGPERDEHEARFGGYLPLRQVALLAGVDEKTVRNAAANAKAPLKSKAIGGRTYFEVAEVRKWLETRGQLLPTILLDASNARDLKSQPFTSPEDFFQYARGRARALSFNLDAGAPGSIRERVSDWIAGWGSGKYEFNFDYAFALADMLDVPVVEFVPAVLALSQAVQRDQIRGEINARIKQEVE